MPAPYNSHCKRTACTLQVPVSFSASESAFSKASCLLPRLWQRLWRKHLRGSLRVLSRSLHSAPAQINNLIFFSFFKRIVFRKQLLNLSKHFWGTQRATQGNVLRMSPFLEVSISRIYIFSKQFLSLYMISDSEQETAQSSKSLVWKERIRYWSVPMLYNIKVYLYSLSPHMKKFLPG